MIIKLMPSGLAVLLLCIVAGAATVGAKLERVAAWGALAIGVTECVLAITFIWSS